MKHLLVISRGGGFGSPEWHQVWPFEMYRHEIRTKLDMTIEMVEAVSLDAIRAAIESRRPDVAIIMVDWREPTDRLCRMLQDLRSNAECPLLIFLDYYAPTCTPHFAAISYVDVYVKRQILRQKSQYRLPLRGGFVITNFLAEQMGYEVADWYFGSELNESEEHKLIAGWNLGIAPRYRNLLKISRSWLGRRLWRWENRAIEVNRRFAPIQGDNEWYARYRREALTAVLPLENKYRCSGTTRVSGRKYFLELLRSKIVFSPFGWGEVCFRDYEAVACGALLVKPSMSHLKTNPDIFVADETYIETTWDLKDVVQKCEYYLAHPKKAADIARNAQDVLFRYFECGGFCHDLGRVLNQLPEFSSKNCTARRHHITPESQTRS